MQAGETYKIEIPDDAFDAPPWNKLSEWKDFILNIAGLEVTLVSKLDRVYHGPGWDIDKSLNGCCWVPELWLKPINNLMPCTCQRDLFTLEHKCDRLAGADRRQV